MTLDLLQRSRSALLDALEALREQRDSVIVIGAQAVYLRTKTAPVALAEATKDSDLALDPRELLEDPLIEEAMQAAGFILDPFKRQPGAWVNEAGIPVDLMVPEALAGPGGKGSRSARIAPHAKQTARRAKGLEGTLVDNSPLQIEALDPDDARRYEALVAGPAALVVAKLHKLWERRSAPHRLNDKDAHDLYRILVDVPTDELASGFAKMRSSEVSVSSANEARAFLADLFGDPDALGSSMAGRAEVGFGDPETVAVAVSALSQDLLARL